MSPKTSGLLGLLGLVLLPLGGFSAIKLAQGTASWFHYLILGALLTWLLYIRHLSRKGNHNV